MQCPARPFEDDIFENIQKEINFFWYIDVSAVWQIRADGMFLLLYTFAICIIALQSDVLCVCVLTC